MCKLLLLTFGGSLGECSGVQAEVEGILYARDDWKHHLYIWRQSYFHTHSFLGTSAEWTNLFPAPLNNVLTVPEGNTATCLFSQSPIWFRQMCTRTRKIRKIVLAEGLVVFEAYINSARIWQLLEDDWSIVLLFENLVYGQYGNLGEQRTVAWRRGYMSLRSVCVGMQRQEWFSPAVKREGYFQTEKPMCAWKTYCLDKIMGRRGWLTLQMLKWKALYEGQLWTGGCAVHCCDSA